MADEGYISAAQAARAKQAPGRHGRSACHGRLRAVFHRRRAPAPRRAVRRQAPLPGRAGRAHLARRARCSVWPRRPLTPGCAASTSGAVSGVQHATSSPTSRPSTATGTSDGRAPMAVGDIVPAVVAATGDAPGAPRARRRRRDSAARRQVLRRGPEGRLRLDAEDLAGLREGRRPGLGAGRRRWTKPRSLPPARSSRIRRLKARSSPSTTRPDRFAR